MALKTELQAYSSKINLPLFNSIIAFILDTADAARTRRAELRRQCPFLSAQAGGSLQKQYGFLYLGELLERYEERFGMSVPDLRAIALALAYTCDLTTDEMFIGPQRDNFLRNVRKAAGGDIYLTGALYLLDTGKNGEEKQLAATGYDSTEDLLFVLGLFPNQEQALLRFKPQLLRLLGKERTMPFLGNSTVLAWLIAWLTPHIKSARGKDMALFRTLCALPISHVKPGSKPHDTLLEHGCTPLEIAYANMFSVLTQAVDGALKKDSIVTEKIAVELFREALTSDTQLSPETCDQLTSVYRMYERFPISCYGCKGLMQVLEEDTRIRNPGTFLWFSTLTNIYSPVFSGFDIMDGKWDPLAGALEPDKYITLFETCLEDALTREEIQRRLDRYRELTGGNYAGIYWNSSRGGCFNLLIQKDILDLWSLFTGSLGENGQIDKPEMLSHIWNHVRYVCTSQAFRFFEQFFSVYGAADLERFFGYRYREFFEGLTNHRDRYNYGCVIRLNLHRDYLDDSGHRKLLQWLEEYIFTYQPEKYAELIVAILNDETAAALFSAEGQRALFDLIAKQPDIAQSVLSELKRRYLTEAEQQAEQDAALSARRETERRRREKLVQSIREKYAELSDGSFFSALKFLGEYKYYRDEMPIACHILREKLDGLLDAQNYELDGQEAAQLLSICDKLTFHRAMNFAEAQSYISKVKERDEHDANSQPE